APVAKTTGIVFVAAFAANADGRSNVEITDTLRATSSPASDDKRLYWPSAQRHSMLTFLPSVKPVSFSPWMRPASAPGNAPGAALPKTPITRRGSCARAVTDHVAAAPPRNVMNSRRFISRPFRLRRTRHPDIIDLARQYDSLVLAITEGTERPDYV